MADPNISDVEALVRDWGNKFAARYHTSCKWTDLYAKQHDMKKYQQYKVTFEPQDIHYGEPHITPQPDSYVYYQWTDNDTDLPQSSIFVHSTTTTSTFQWSLTEGLKLASMQEVQLKGKASLPLVAEGEVQVKVGFTEELNFSSTQQKTETTTETWSIQENVTAEAQRSTRATWHVNKTKIDVPFTYDIRMTGSVAIWLHDKRDIGAPDGNGPNRHWLWFIPVARVFAEINNPNYVNAGGAVVFRARGTFSGVGATQSYMDVKAFPLRPTSARAADAPEPAAAPLSFVRVPLQGEQVRAAA